MGGLLVLMLIVLIGGVAWKAARRGEAPPEPPKLLDLPSAALEQMLLDGDRLALRTAAEIVVIDVRKGTVLLRLSRSRNGPAP